MKKIQYSLPNCCSPVRINNSLRGGGASTALLAAVLLGTMPAVANELDIPTLGDESAYTLTKVDAE